MDQNLRKSLIFGYKRPACKIKNLRWQYLPLATIIAKMKMQRKLKMKFAGRFIDLLGQQMYGGPVPAVAELIANAWDADADKVDVKIPADPTEPKAEIVVKDFGDGMTYDEINEFYLSLGYERRKRGERTQKNRLVMGRKGIGKLAGFGIAEDIIIKSVKAGHLIQFNLNYTALRKTKVLDGFVIMPERDERSKEASGVTVTFRNLKLTKAINVDDFRLKMGRRSATSKAVKGRTSQDNNVSY
jgi:hypothetical protein